MSSPNIKFILRAVLIALICYLTTVILSFFVFKKSSFLEIYLLIPFIMIVTIGFHALLIKATKSNTTLFVNKYIAFSGIKLLIYIITILIYLIFIKFEDVIFMLSFFIIYFIYTIAEISSLLQIFKKS